MLLIRLFDVRNVREEIFFFRCALLFALGDFIEQAIAAISSHGVLALDPLVGEFDDERRLGEGGIAGRKHMCQVAALQLFDLCLGLFDGHGFRIIDEQRDNFHLVDLCLPELPGEFWISTDRLGEFTQLRQSDAETL